MPRKPTPVGPPVPEPTEDRRRRLLALRDRLEDAIGDASSRDLAPLAGRYQSVLAELASLPEVKGSEFDDLAARRSRRSGSAAS